MAVYLDSSALVKLVVRESESAALRRFLRAHPERVSCGLARTEVPRAVRHLGPAALRRARLLLRRVHLIRLDDALLDAAAALDPRILRTLDAIHLAAAQLVSPEIEAIVTYDQRMTAAAALLGFAVIAPGQPSAHAAPETSEGRPHLRLLPFTARAESDLDVLLIVIALNPARSHRPQQRLHLLPAHAEAAKRRPRRREALAQRQIPSGDPPPVLIRPREAATPR